MAKGIMAALVLALAVAPGCWVQNAGGPLLISFVDAQSGKPFQNGPVYGIYSTQEQTTDGTVVQVRGKRIQSAVYPGDALLGADVPKHVAAGYLYGPGVAWAERWVIVAEGFEAPKAHEWTYMLTKEPTEHVVLLNRLSSASISFESIQQFIAVGGEASDVLARDVPADGLDATTRRAIAQILLGHYRTWTARWGDAEARLKFYRQLADTQDYDPLNRRGLDENAEIARQEWEPVVRDAGFVAARLEKLAQ
jgi:hypothetical protein